MRPETWTEAIEGRTVIGVYIPESQAGDKPIFFRSRGLPKGAYRRIGSTDQRCTEARSGQTFDEMPVADATLGDIDPEAVADYRRARGAANPEAVELGWTDEELLRALGCLAVREGRAVPTVAGIVLFGTAMALRRCLPMMRLDYIRVPGRDWVADPESGFGSIDMRGPLMRLVQRGVAAVLDDLPKAFRLPPGEMQRVDEPVIPVRVLREALVNALMHRSYRLHGAVQVIRYSNRLEIRNPGHSLVAEERLGEPSSRTRNPRIAAVLHETRFAETKGSGIRVMREAMAAANLSPPTFESDRDKDEFVATLLFHHFLSDADLQWLARFQDLGLTSDEAKALVFVRETGAIHNAAYRNLNGVDTLAASAKLRHLRDIGLLEQHDRGSATYYTPTTRLTAPGEVIPSIVQRELPLDDGESQGFRALSQGFDALLQGLGPQSQGSYPVSQGAAESEAGSRACCLKRCAGWGGVTHRERYGRWSAGCARSAHSAPTRWPGFSVGARAMWSGCT